MCKVAMPLTSECSQMGTFGEHHAGDAGTFPCEVPHSAVYWLILGARGAGLVIAKSLLNCIGQGRIGICDQSMNQLFLALCLRS